MMTKIISYVLIIVCMLKCERKNLSYEIDDFISQNKNTELYNSLTNGYKFKLYKDGVGQDLLKPIYNDTIILLKNQLTENINTQKINNGVIVLLDSFQICSLSYIHDERREVMRSFISISKKEDRTAININNWVPTYNSHNCKNIDFGNGIEQ